MLQLLLFYLWRIREINKRRRIIAQTVLLVLKYLLNTKWKKSNKLHSKIRKYKGRRSGALVPRRQAPRNRGPIIGGTILDIDVFERTGIYEDTFEEIFELVSPLIEQPRAIGSQRITVTSLEPRTRLLLVLHWLRHYPLLSELRNIYHISKSFITREVRHIMPILCAKVSLIHWPDKWFATGFFNTHIAIDCTAHYRWRVHPGQADYYRGDKHAHLISGQIIISRTPRRIVHIALGLGHNNDQGMLKLTEIDTYMEDNQLLALGDGGYHHHRIITPDKVPPELEQTQKDERSDVEVVIGLGKGFGLAGEVCRHSPELHACALEVVYNLVQSKLV